MKSSLVLRARILCGVFILIAGLLILRLYFVQIVHGEQYQESAMGQYVQADPQTQDRGDIYFTTNTGQLVAAAVSESGYIIAIDPQTLQDPQAAYSALNAIAPIDKTTFMNAAANTSATYVVVAQHLPASVGTPIQTLNVPGVILAPDEWRDYPADDLAAQTIGFVGFNGTSTDETGIYGLERYYDETLSSPTSGLYVNPFAEIFTNVADLVASDPTSEHGAIITSIEPNVQQELVATLQQVMNAYTPAFDGGIIMDPHTGAIYAMAQLPSFDPNSYNTASGPSVYTNILVSGRYEMGSIMKPLTMAAGIDSGAVTPQTTYDDTGCITVSGAKLCNFDFRARGVIPMGQILDQSLNVGASWVATKTTYPVFTNYMKSFFDQKTGIDLPNETSADLANLDNGHAPAVNYDTASFGQGITVSPIQMIRALSALANGGVMPDPHVVTAIQYESGVTRQVPVGAGVQVFKASTAQQVTQMLETVYDDYELNGAIKMQHYTAAAKTGTAQIPDPATGGYYPGAYYIHSFFGYFPATDPRFIIFLYAYHPIGQEYSAYTWDEPYYQLEQFLINYYNIPPDR